MSFTSLPTLINYFSDFTLHDLRICMNVKTNTNIYGHNNNISAKSF